MEGDTSLETVAEGGTDNKVAATETEAGAEISALVNYVQPVHFTSFESAKSEFFSICICFLEQT